MQNAKLKTVNIQGKPYVPVSERIKYFREHFPKYSLETEIVKVDAESALVRAVIRDSDQILAATGISFEKAGSSFINKTSHVENAETSAWGRALANFGIGIDDSVASADEIAVAMNAKREVLPPPVIHENPPIPGDVPSTELQRTRIFAAWGELVKLKGWDKMDTEGMRKRTMKAKYGVDSSDDLQSSQAAHMLEAIKNEIKKIKAGEQDAPKQTGVAQGEEMTTDESPIYH